MQSDIAKYRRVDAEYWEERDPDFGFLSDPDLVRWGVRLLDPTSAVPVDGITPRPTAYLGSNLLVDESAAGTVQALAELAKSLRWELVLDREAQHTSLLDDSVVGVRRYVLRQADGGSAPDAWILLQLARSRQGLDALRGVSLEHLLLGHPGHWESNPGHWESNPGHWESNPMAIYGLRGEGGRQPVSYTGPPPPRTSDEDWKARCQGSRVVVGVLDTGCGAHPWLTDDIVDRDVRLDGKTIGFGAAATPPDPSREVTSPARSTECSTSCRGTAPSSAASSDSTRPTPRWSRGASSPRRATSRNGTS
ncbi:MAG: hypothetical protein R2731_13150 [Nocardioides sp.]